MPLRQRGRELTLGLVGFIFRLTMTETTSSFSLPIMLDRAGRWWETQICVDQWQRIECTITIAGGDLAGNLDVREQGSTPTAGKFFYVDAVQIEARAYTTPDCDGSLGTGFSWSGTAHASTSARTGTFNNIYSAGLNTDFDGQEGSFVVWAKVSGARVWTNSINNTPLYIRVNDGNRMHVRITSANSRIQWLYRADSTNNLREKTGLSTTDWFVLGMSWSIGGDETIAYYNGVQEGATITSLGTWSGNLASTFCNIGAEVTTPTFVWDGTLAHAAIWKTPLTATQMAALAVV